MKNKVIKCACGCGTKLFEKDNRNRKRKFISGHNLDHTCTIGMEKFYCDWCGVQFVRYRSKFKQYEIQFLFKALQEFLDR